MKDGVFSIGKVEKAHRILSVGMLCVLAAFTFSTSGFQASIGVLMVFALPIACIWFPEELSELTGMHVGRGWVIDEKSNPKMLRWGGWFLLVVVPVLMKTITSNIGKIPGG